MSDSGLATQCRELLGSYDGALAVLGAGTPVLDAAGAVILSFVGDESAALRSRLFVGQIATELALTCGGPTNRARALEALELVAARGLFDRLWIDRCPLLAPLTDEPRFAAARRAIVERAAAVLDAYRSVETGT